MKEELKELFANKFYKEIQTKLNNNYITFSNETTELKNIVSSIKSQSTIPSITLQL